MSMKLRVALLLLVVGATFFATVGGRLGRWVAARSAPDAVTSPPPVTHDFGVVLPGQRCQQSFPIRNGWAGELRVTGVETSCGCTGARLDKDVIPAGESATLTIDLAARETGETVRVEAVVSGQVLGKAVAFRHTLLASAPPLIEIADDSYYMDIGETRVDGAPLTKVLELRRGASPVPWETVTCEASDSQLHVRQIPASEGEWKFELTYPPTGVLGTLSVNLSIHFLHNGAPLDTTVVRRVTGRIAGPLEITPESLLLGTVESGASVERGVRLAASAAGVGPVTVKTFRSSEPSRVRAVAAAAGEAVDVRISYTAPAVAGPDEGYVDVVVQCAGREYCTRIAYLAMVGGPEEQGGAAAPKPGSAP